MQGRDQFWVETVILEFTSKLYAAMERKGYTKADLARILGTSQAYITKIFRGNANFTIESMIKLSRALGYRLHIHIAQEEEKFNWSDILPLKKKPTVNYWLAADNYRKIDNDNNKKGKENDLPAAA